MNSTTKLSGTFKTWKFPGTDGRIYADVYLPYHKFRHLFKVNRYCAVTGSGEQRVQQKPHVRKINREMAAGRYTPTQLSANLSQDQIEKLILDHANARFELEVSPTNPLSLTDGGHRREAIETELGRLQSQLEKASAPEERASLQRSIDELLANPMDVRIYFDGNSKTDFVALQAGKAVDHAHILSLRIQQNDLGDDYSMAFAIAKKLESSVGFFEKSIRFDSATVEESVSINTLCAKSSDFATSLLGLVKVGKVFRADISPAQLADFVLAATNEVSRKAPELTEQGKLLAPLAYSGTKGAMCLYVGLGVVLAFRVLAAGRKSADSTDLTRLVKAVRETMADSVNGNLSGPRKRTLIGEFASEFLADSPDLFGRLVAVFSPACFGLK
jgi:hypothetical protein